MFLSPDAPAIGATGSIQRRWPLLILFGVLPMLATGLFARNCWTPDEPRELAIAASMATQEWKAVPQFAGQPYSEKPPLTYWLAGSCLATIGRDVRIARLPNLLYALVGVFTVALLARTMVQRAGGSPEAAALAAVTAGIAEGTMELTWQVQIWLSSDAPLLLGVCLALWGAWRGAGATPGREKFTWYLVMHVGLLIGFFSKNVIAWIIPGLALCSWLLWERRWRELGRWELWSGFLLQAPCIVWWISAVLAHPDGPHQLRIAFVDNLFGRFLPIASEAGYSEAHRNFPGKYLLELPPYLAPWLFLAVVAARRAWRACREPGPARSAWRFAVAIIVPNLVLLSVAHTARGIYLAPVMVGWALLIGLWCCERLSSPDRSERFAIWATVGLLALMTVAMPAVLVLASRVWEARWPTMETWAIAGASVFGMAIVLPGAWRSARRGDFAGSLWRSLAAFSLVLATSGFAAIGVFNRWQDQEVVAAAAAAVGADLVLYDPDETIVAVLDWYRGVTPPSVRGEVALERALAMAPHARVMLRMPGKEDAYQARGEQLRQRFGLHIVHAIDIPHGRRYAIFAGADHS